MEDVRNIIFVGLYEDDNLGDKIIYECARKLYEKYASGLSYKTKCLSLNPPVEERKPSVIKRAVYKVRKIIGAFLFKRNYFSATTKQKLNEAEKYYYENIQGADLIILTGGGLIKYKYQFCCWGSLSALLRAADKRNIKVWLNAVGVEGYDEREHACRYLKDSIQLPCVKKISVRDDITTLIDKYFDGNPQCECKMVADAAVWAGEVYNITKRNDSKIIGIGIGHKHLFERDEIKHPVKLKEFYIDLIKRLLNEQQSLILFTNGGKEDNETAKEICDAIKSEGIIIELYIPNADKDLIEIIAKCKGIIAARLHSCIIAYSLDIPCVGMVWNEKVAFFGEEIGYPNRFLRDYEIYPQETIAQIEEALENGYDEKKRDEYRETIIDSIKTNIKDI